MSTVVHRRPARRTEPEYPSGEVLLEPPPEVPPPTGRGWAQLLMMVPMLAGSASMALMFAGQRGSPLAYLTGGMFGLSALGMLAAQFGQHSGPGKQEMLLLRRNYLRHLGQRRRQVRRAGQRQRAAQLYRHPDPESLWSIPASQRLWERRPGDPDFGMVRIAIGTQELATPLIPPQSKPLDDLDPMCAVALRRFMTTYANIDGLPMAMALDGFARVYLRGDPERVRGLVRAVLAQAAVFHAPDDLLIAVCPAPAHAPHWEWLKWLPHGLHPGRTDAVGQLRLNAPNVPGLEAMLDDVLANRPRFNPAGTAGRVGQHLIVVLDGGDVLGSDHLMTEGGVEGVTVLDLSGAPPRLLDQTMLVLDIAADATLTSTTFDARGEVGKADGLSLVESEGLALQLAPLRLSAASRTELRSNADIDLADLLEIGPPGEYEPARHWVPRPQRDRLRVPVGWSPDGSPVELDLKESAQDGMGPHGLLIGATGSGKSELLRTLVLALAVTHSPEVLNFVLVDFKGGATFTKLDVLPHTSAVITNLADELPLVDRMTDAINGELLRRQELLRKAGQYASQRDYEKARAAGAPLAPLPSLLIICDEFSELLTAKPDFIDMFVQIGRVGRSLGVHLLLASQRLEEGRLRGLDTHLSYRIGLRTFSAVESRIVLGDTAAFELPRSPGHGYLRFGTEPLRRFRAAYVSGGYRRDAPALLAAGAGPVVRDYVSGYVAPPVVEEPATAVPEPAPDAVGESVLDILVDRMRGQGVPAHQVWLPPLDEPPTLDALLPARVLDPDRGLSVQVAQLHGSLHAVVGIVDRPLEQRRDPLWWELSGAAGHVLVVGGPQSGKSTLLRTLILSLALTHTPREAQFYCLDFGGGALTSLRDLPHVGGVATRLDAGEVRRTVAELALLLAERERRFATDGIDSMATYRRARRTGRYPDDPFGDAFLVIDGWATVRQDFEDLEPTVNDLTNRGLTYGVHVVTTATRWSDVRPAVRDLFGNRLELRLGDPSDSMIDRRAAMNVPDRIPGRGVVPGGLQFLSALPRIDGRQAVDDLADGVDKLVQEIRHGWREAGAPPVRLLPATLPYQSLPVTDRGRSGLPIGIAEADLRPVWIDFSTESHLILFGDSGSGKSAFLRAIGQSIVDRYELTEARIIVIDYRHSLLSAITSPHLIGTGSTAQASEKIITEVIQVLRSRLPGPEVTAEQLRKRTWWQGPELYLLVDDYDLVAGGSTNPITPLLEFLSQARDVGLHLILTRRSGGASRALYESVLMRLRELGSPGILLSGDREEGALLGNVRPSLQPPGRGWLVTRREGSRLVQLAWLPPPE